MMATNSQQLDDLEDAFLEAIEPRPHSVTKTSKPRRTTVGSWWRNVKDKFVSKLICCTPSKALLDDDEIADLLASMEEPIKHNVPIYNDEELSVLADISFVLHDECTDLKSIPVIADYASDASTEAEESSDDERKPTPTEVLSRVSTAVVAVTTMQSLVHERKQRAAVATIQQRWRQKKDLAQTVAHMTPTANASAPEPKIEQKSTAIFTPAPSKRRRSRRTRKHRSHGKKTKIVEEEPVIHVDVEPVAEPESEAAIFNIEVLSKKRQRTVTTTSTTPSFVLPIFHPQEPQDDIEREDEELVSFFGEETIDQDFHVHDYHSMTRCNAIVPPVTACRPTPIKSHILQQTQAIIDSISTTTSEVVPQESIEYEESSQMSEIRAKIAVVQRRLQLLRSRSSCSETEGPQDESEDFDWL